MKFLFLTIIMLISVVAWLYSYGTVSSCQAPLRYSIGNIDEPFALTYEEAKTAVAEATAVWEPLSNRPLFLYDEEATLKVNFIFDDRHARFQTREMWQAELNRLEAEFRSYERQYEVAEQRYTALTEELRLLEQVYTELSGRFEDTPNDRISPRELRNQVSDLERAKQAVNQKISEVNEVAAEINRLVELVNDAVDTYNIEAEQFNAQFGEGESFTQGDFTRAAINIYTFTDQNELQRVLAHEFGHALGLEHVEGEDSLMYYMVSDSNDVAGLSEFDIAEFRRVCPADESWSARLATVSAFVTHHINKFIYSF